jgi:hypothetical protein
MTEFRTDAQILKVNAELGLIFGFAMICKVRDENGNLVPYNDTDDDQFDEVGMLEAITKFAVTKRVACSMHARDEDGEPVQDGGVIHHFPLTSEIAKALDIITPMTGLLVALKPDNPETLEKARRGEFTGFSIGGEVIEAEEA